MCLPNSTDFLAVQALYDSLRAQLPDVATDVTLPSMAGLRNILVQAQNAGDLDLHNADGNESGNGEAGGNVAVDTLTLILNRWGNQYGESLQLCCRLEGGVIIVVSVDDPDARRIWIHNDNHEGQGDPGIPIFNHYEGLRAKTAEEVPEGHDDIEFEEYVFNPDQSEDLLGE